MKAIILAGGFGTRLKSVLGDIPKPMAFIAGKPFLEHQIRYLKEQGITEIILAVHHMADKIKTYFGTGHRWGVEITYSEEEVPLGTAGAIKKAEKYIDDTFLVLNGDSYSHIDMQKFLEFHKNKNSKFTISVTKTNDPSHYGNLTLEDNKIKNFEEKKEMAAGLINSGVYLFEPIILKYIEPNKNLSLEKDLFPLLAREGSLYGYQYEGYFMDIGRPETYQQFKKDFLERVCLREKQKVSDAMKAIKQNDLDLVLVVDETKKLLGVLNNRIIRDYLLNFGKIEDSLSQAMIKDPDNVAKTTDDKNKISEILLSGVSRLPIVDENGRLIDVEFYTENIKEARFPMLRGRAPLRISFAGGGTDLPIFFEKYGGVVVSATINKYCYATIVKRADSKIIIDSDMTKESDVVVESINKLKYDGNFDLIKAIIKLMNPDFGFELYLYNDVPPGRGLGSSASLAVLVVNLLSQLQEVKYGDQKIAEIAYRAEREELGIKGGWQDQYAAVTGGFNFMEFNGDKTLIYPLRLKEEVINELKEHLLLCYVGKSHSSGDLHTKQEEIFKQDESKIVENLDNLKKIALEIRDCLLTNEIEKIGFLLNDSWQNKKKLSGRISDQNIDRLYELGMKNGAYGGKLLGAGGGGYLLFFYPPKKRNQLKRALETGGAELMNFDFEFKGTQVWPVKSKG